MVMGKDFVTTGFVAKELGVVKITVLRWIKRGYLKSIKLPSGRNRIFREEFERFKKSMGIKGDDNAS
jgi:excisionase family DNA binding protein